MKIFFVHLIVFTGLLIPGCNQGSDSSISNDSIIARQRGFPVPAIPFAPRHYVCYKASRQLVIDGVAEESDWQKAPWTDDFVDIEGDLKPRPKYKTRAKLLWDDDFLYISAELTEPDIWATLRQRDTVIFYDNDFEVFIDPDGDTHNYYEFEMNAYGTYWDILLSKPYRDGGPAINSWDIKGARVVTKVYGTINNPASKDDKWTVEIALPWKGLKECAPGGKRPVAGDQWRINFSRVEWKTDVESDKYKIKTDPATGKRLPENNWIWSPQGLINMHYPEMWGYLQFSGNTASPGNEKFIPDPDAKVKWQLRKLYYKQRNYFSLHGRYATVLKELGITNPDEEGFTVVPEIQTTLNMFEVTLPGVELNKSWHIRQDGLVWSK